MSDIGFFLDRIKEKASEKNDDKLTNKINSNSFYNSLSDVCDVLQELGFEFSERKNDEFDYQKDINLRISKALSKNYFTIYYVNIKSGDYIGYSSNNDYNSLKIEESGNDFFGDIKKNAMKVIYKDDIDKVIKNVTKEKIVKEINSGKTFEITYRLILNGKPTFVMLKALKLNDVDSNIIFGISNIDEQKKRELEYQKAMKANITYSNIALALASNYLFIYYIDINTSFYIEYNLDSEYQVLKEVSRGIDFFDGLEAQAKDNIVPEDQERFLSVVNKDNLLSVIKKGNIVKVTYRQLFNNKPIFVELTALKMSSDSSHIILAISSIDSWKKKEDEFNRKLIQEKVLARTDALTGALNKYSYKELEKKINKQIKNNTIDDFSIVVCDINNLKNINDTLGHEAGDKYIKSAKKLIHNIFQNSDIYRIGGDEFVLFLEESDFYIRDFLYEKINDEIYKNQKLNKVTIAIGISDFNKDIDTSVADVFKRADDRMYEYKKNFKEQFQ